MSTDNAALDVDALADRIARVLGARLDGRTGTTPEHQEMSRTYDEMKSAHPSWSWHQCAHEARRRWVAKAIREAMLRAALYGGGETKEATAP